MNKLIIATHGYMAKGIKSALAIIAGDVSNVIDINAFTENVQTWISGLQSFCHNIRMMKSWF